MPYPGIPVFRVTVRGQRLCISCCSLILLWSCLPVAAATLSVCLDEDLQSKTLASPLIDDSRIHLQVNDSDPVGDCEHISLPIAELAFRWGRIIRNTLLAQEQPTVILQGQFTTAPVSVSEIIIPESEPPVSDETLPVLATPRATAANPVDYRSGWLWQPGWWQDNPENTWALAAETGLKRLYVTIPVSNGSVDNPALLASFLSAAHARDIDVWAVAGDRRDVISDNLPMLTGRASAYRQFNTGRPPPEQLDGLQLDIEPYLLQGFNLDQTRWRERYVQTITAVYDTLSGTLPLDLALPVWWGVHPQWGEQLFDAISLPQLSVTVMNYRTDVERLYGEALPFLVWGEQSGNKVHMALESGPLIDEQRLHFYPAQKTGELWQIQVGNYQVLVLLDDVYAGLPGRSWQQAFESQFSAANLTFHNDRAALDNAARILVRDWSAWSSFAGIAIHGVDTFNTTTPSP